MSEPPQHPQPPGGDWQSPEVPGAPAPDDASPERPPPYPGVYGGQSGYAPPAAAPAPAPAAGYGQPGYPPPGYGPPGRQDMIAGRGARLGAGILDSIVLSVVATPAVLFSIRWDKMEESVTSGEPITNPLDLYNIPRLLAGYAIAFLLGFAYFTVLHAKWGQTLGKRAAGIRLVSAADRSAVSWGQALGRQAFVYAITITTVVLNLVAPALGILGLVTLLDNAWILWDERRQAVHDKVAGTLVVKAAPWMPNPYARPGSDGPGKL